MRLILDRCGPGIAPRTLRMLGPRDIRARVGVFSFADDVLPAVEIADALENEFGILVRAGLHCAPLMHRALRTADSGGAVRLSIGPFVTEEDAAYAADSLAEVCERRTLTVHSRNLATEPLSRPPAPAHDP
jgi:selenocysteine lyase/cysteine desulfurase